MHIYITQSFWTGTKVIRRKHIVQPIGFDACSSTCCQWDGRMCQRHGSDQTPTLLLESKNHVSINVYNADDWTSGCVGPGIFNWFVCCLSVTEHRWEAIQLAALNTLWPRQNGRQYADDTFKWIFLNENVWISIKISQKFVLNGRINNIPTFVQIMA